MTSGIGPELVHDIEQHILGRGTLSREEILLAWNLPEELYPALQATLLSRNHVARLRGGEGFAVKPSRSRIPEEGEAPSFLREPWEQAAVERLVELLTHKQLEELVGDLTHTVRHARLARDGVDRRGTKQELASALVVRHSVDLLADGAVRSAVGKACAVAPPRRWVAGKPAAVDFTAAAAMPRECAGLPLADRPPAYEYLEGRFVLRPLEDFQQEILRALAAGFGTPSFRTIVTLPTGAGKTRVAVQAIRDWLTARYDREYDLTARSAVLWLAHTEELCEQAAACFRQVWEASEDVAPLLLVRFWGAHTRDLETHRATLGRILESPSVLVSTPQRILNVLAAADERTAAVSANLRLSLGVLVVDEAHRAAARSYRTVIDGLVGRRPDVPVVGLTATPFRMEYADAPTAGTAELREVFRRLTEPRSLGDQPREELQRRRVLARPRFETIETHVAMTVPETAAEVLSEHDVERIDRALALRADIARRRHLVLERILPIAAAPGHLTLYFGPSVNDAECMAYLLREQRIPAGVVSGQTREGTRRLLIERFRRGELRVLCNCEVLTTGFDAPRVTHVVMARPTVSQVLYEQMVGRGLRGPRFGGTETCTILDCQDDFERPHRPALGYMEFRRLWGVA
jgi:superfamily II DNA or RNA helicase